MSFASINAARYGYNIFSDHLRHGALPKLVPTFASPTRDVNLHEHFRNRLSPIAQDRMDCAVWTLYARVDYETQIQAMSQELKKFRVTTDSMDEHGMIAKTAERIRKLENLNLGLEIALKQFIKDTATLNLQAQQEGFPC